MSTMLSPRSRKAVVKRLSVSVSAKCRSLETRLRAIPGSLYRAARKTARWSKKLAFYFLPPLLYSSLKLLLPRIVQAPVRQQFAEAVGPRLVGLRQQCRASEPSTWADSVGIIAGGFPDQLARYRELHLMGESSPSLLEAKVRRAEQLFYQHLPDRVRLLRELARLADLQGRHLLGSAYRVRAIRLLGIDAYHDLPRVVRTMVAHDFTREAEALKAIYEDQSHALSGASSFSREPWPSITNPRDQWSSSGRRTVAILRSRVAVIVSLYKAADKLPLFLHAVRSQTLLQSRQLELILVDSGSPDDEHAALSQTLAEFALPYFYVRTATRETIQTAWNRGIGLARAPYLSFLGVDETVTADALAVLADALDDDPTVDWVTGDSLLTEVDEKGRWLRDVMTYDRDGYTQNHVYLETCYLSWVGAMYRRSIHDRFGYYDGSFRATGDNEFKCRILPFIKTQRIPRLLGSFLNYPDPRATGSPVAELEDIRAWYLHRTPGGVRYAMKDRDPSDVEKLLLLSLHYRKSYTKHSSSDVEFAANVSAYLQERLPTSPLVGLSSGVDRLLQAVRVHDHLEPFTPSGFVNGLRFARETWDAVRAEHRRGPWLKQVDYDFRRDNRHEQHAFVY